MPPTTEQEHRRKKQIQTSMSSYLQPSNQSTSRNPNSSPELPDATQAMLISVGMRVRKSVPEGYKTHKTEINTKAGSRALQKKSHPSQPVCGLHNVGGFAQQEWLSAEDEDNLISSEEALSSQDSRASTASEMRKRTFEEEQDVEDDVEYDQLDNTLLNNMVDLTEDRPIARARNRTRRDVDFEEAPFLRPRDVMDID